MLWRDLDGCVRRLFETAERSVVVAAPFIKREALERLLAAAPASAGLEVFTRWRAEEVAAGVSDPDILTMVEARGGRVWLCDELHAKLYLVDGTRALVGSANVTAAGLGLSARPNLELMQPAELAPAEAALFVAELRARSRRASAEDAARALEAAAQVSPPPQPPADAQPLAPSPAAAWFPRFRSPDRLYSLASDADWLGRADASEPALRDVLALGVTPGGGEGAFEAAVRRELLASPLVKGLDAFLSQPRRFGALTDWLREVLPDADHEARQAAGQTLIRWLTYFAPERYEVGTPGAYSEVLSLRRD